MARCPFDPIRLRGFRRSIFRLMNNTANEDPGDVLGSPAEQVGEAEFQQILMAMLPKRVVGPDRFPAEVWKVGIQWLQQLFNH